MQIPNSILILIEKYLAGTATVEEKNKVNEWYQSISDEYTEIETLQNEDEQILAERIKTRLLHTIQKYDPVVSNTTRRKWIMPAAVVIFLLISAVTFFIFMNNSGKNKNAIAKQAESNLTTDIGPGGNKAVLTLADNSTIILDSASNGIISQQGNISVQKLENGLLAYTIKGKLITENDEAFYNTISTPRGGQYQVTLADGTQVWLNAASSIRFPVVFTGKERKVVITGEAYFEVATNHTMPFRVEAVSSEIEVLGTHFNVNAYDDEPSIKTTLLEGSVKVYTRSSPQQSKTIKPGQQTSISKEGIIKLVNNADIEEAVAWKNGNFQFKSADLKSILRQISRWYDVDIEYKGNADLHFTGQLTRSDNASKVFEKLALTGEVQFKVEGRKIIVSQ